VRQRGGELARARPDSGALAAVDAGYSLYAVGIAPTPEAAAQLGAHIEVLEDALRPWTAEQTYLNFAKTRRDPRTLWTEKAHHRLRRIKAAVDPDSLIRSNHPIAAAPEKAEFRCTSAERGPGALARRTGDR
jgi:Berberine and berberine like